MGFDIGKALAGGALLGIDDGSLSKDKKFSLEQMLTEEQKQAQQLLAKLAQTGEIGGINTGEAYTGSLGNFQASGTEDMAINRIRDLLTSGTPSSLNKAEETLTNLANTTFDPSDPSSGFAAYQRQVARATKDADDVLDREAAITGSRFGSRLQGSKVDLAERQSDLLSTKLAELYNTSQNRALAGAQGLTGLAGMKDSIDLNRINTASSIGGLQRMLDTAKAQAQYGEWQRSRNERLGAVTGAAESLWGRNVPYGKKSLTTSSVTPLGQLLNAGLTAGGSAIGNIFLPGIGGAAGGMIGSTAGSMITGADNSGANTQLMDLLMQNMNKN